MNLTLIVGSPCSGFSLLSRLLRDHPGVPRVDELPVRRRDRLRAHVVRPPGRPAPLRLPRATAGTPARLIAALHRAAPGARIVHLVRDGPDCALAMSRDPALRRLAGGGGAALGALWSSIVIDSVAALRTLPAARTLTLSYEDLHRSPEATLIPLAATIGIAVDGDWLARARHLLSPAPAGATRPGPDAALEAACAPGTAALGRRAGSWLAQPAR